MPFLTRRYNLSCERYEGVTMAKNSKLYEEKICRRCKRPFTQAVGVSLYNGNGGFINHRYCQRCRDLMKDRARMCDPRYCEIGGHAAMEIAR